MPPTPLRHWSYLYLVAGGLRANFLQPPGRPVSDHQPGGYADQPPEHTGHDASGRDSARRVQRPAFAVHSPGLARVPL